MPFKTLVGPFNLSCARTVYTYTAPGASASTPLPLFPAKCALFKIPGWVGGRPKFSGHVYDMHTREEPGRRGHGSVSDACL